MGTISTPATTTDASDQNEATPHMSDGRNPYFRRLNARIERWHARYGKAAWLIRWLIGVPMLALVLVTAPILLIVR
jgi:hypothetical protein